MALGPAKLCGEGECVVIKTGPCRKFAKPKGLSVRAEGVG